MRRILTIAAVVALFITGFWGYREHQQKQALLLQAENQYQRAFHNLSSNMDLLQDELGKSLAMNTQRQLGPCLTNIWRISYNAQNDAGQLPLTLMPFNRTQEFLHNLGEFSYRVAIRDQKKEPLTQKEWGTLQALYTESNGIEQDLQKLQSDVLDKNLRWMDAEMALTQTSKKTDNQIVDGFRSIETKVSAYPEIQSDTLTAMKSRTKPHIENLSGPEISQQEAVTKTAAFLGRTDTSGITAQKNGQGNQYPSYSVTVSDKNGKKYYLEMTAKGGHVTWLMDERNVTNATLDLVAAQEKGQQWLNTHGYNNLDLVKAEQYDNTGVYTFVPRQDGVLIYPDTVTIRVALDNGEVTGYNAKDYLFHHKTRNLSKPKLSLQQAQKNVSNKMQVQETAVALIEDEMGKEVLTYEFTGTMDNNTFRVYVNGQNGDEERVEKMKQI